MPLVAFLFLPVVALLFTTTAHELREAWSHPAVWPALRLSLTTTAISLCFVALLGTPLAWYLARTSGPWTRALETTTQLPIVMPPAVAGVALLLAFGRRGLLSSLFCPQGCSLAFTTGAVIMAEIFVSAPYYIQTATNAFRQLDTQLIVVAQTFGASPWRVFSRVALPLSAPALIAGGAMSWARSLGEFGATLMFAGNLEGETQTLPLAIYTALESDFRLAHGLSLALVGVAFGVLLLAKGWLHWKHSPRELAS